MREGGKEGRREGGEGRREGGRERLGWEGDLGGSKVQWLPVHRAMNTLKVLPGVK